VARRQESQGAGGLGHSGNHHGDPGRDVAAAFADTGVLSRVFAARSGADTDSSREMAALGVANLACGAAGRVVIV
jgi:hypothetical protein